MLRSFLLISVVLLSACSLLDHQLIPSEAPPQRPLSEAEAGALPDLQRAAPVPAQHARDRLAYVQEYVAQTRRVVPQWHRADAPLAQAVQAADQQQWAQALGFSDEAAAQADIALSDFYARQANIELAKAQASTGLDDAQILQLRTAEEIMASGNSRLAYGRLRTLNGQLRDQTRAYQVRAGDAVLDALVFAGNVSPVRDVMVGGRWTVRDGVHADERSIAASYRRALERLLED